MERRHFLRYLGIGAAGAGLSAVAKKAQLLPAVKKQSRQNLNGRW